MPNLPGPVPDHVPAELVFDFDYFLPGGMFSREPHIQVSQYLHGSAPDIFYTPRNSGHWVVTRAADGLEVFRNNELFSTDPRFNRWKDLETRHIPLQYDPPEHDALRRMFTSFFTPAQVKRMEEGIRSQMRELIGSFRDRGSCRFVHELSNRFPVTVFLNMVGAPLSDLDMLVGHAQKYFRSADRATSDEGFSALVAYASGLIEARRRQPGNDLISHILASTPNGEHLTRKEVLGAVQFFFLAGLDTVASMLSAIALFLARNPDHYARLVAEPSRIPEAVEELMRISSPSISERGAKADFVFRGVRMKQGDRIVLLPQLYGLDDREVDDPTRVDFDRSVSRHLGFGAGVHRCLGSHLARIELRVFLEEWTRSFPAFSLAEGADPKFLGGIVWVPDEIPLVWDVAAGHVSAMA
jgi:cytochrome P450